MKKMLECVAVAVILLSLMACRQQIDAERERAEILKVYELQIQALLKGEVEAILALIPEGHESLGVGRGIISIRTKADTKQVFEQQFQHGRYTEVNNLVAPTIKISSDGTMAWAVGQFSYTYVFKDSTGTEHAFSAVNAWLSVFEKQNERWVTVAEAETFDK